MDSRDQVRRLSLPDHHRHDVRIFTRNGHNWTEKYRNLVGAAKRLGVESAIIDGEIVVLNEAGLSDFAALRKAITRREQDLYFVAFNGHDLRDIALEDRRETLEGIIEPDDHIQFSQAMPGDAKAIFARTGGPEQRQELTAANIEVEVFDNIAQAIIGLADVAEFDDWCSRGASWPACVASSGRAPASEWPASPDDRRRAEGCSFIFPIWNEVAADRGDVAGPC